MLLWRFWRRRKKKKSPNKCWENGRKDGKKIKKDNSCSLTDFEEKKNKEISKKESEKNINDKEDKNECEQNQNKNNNLELKNKTNIINESARKEIPSKNMEIKEELEDKIKNLKTKNLWLIMIINLPK